MQRGRHVDPAIGALVVLHHRDQRPPYGNAGAVQRVHQLGLALRISEARLTRRATGQGISSVTVSIGVAQFRLAESAETMIERCDRGLYQAKRSGRNWTVTENDIEGETAAA